LTQELEEEIVAYVDGRLDDAARAAFDAKIAQEPDLARKVEAHRWMAHQIVEAFGTPPREEASEADLARGGLSDDRVVAFPARRAPAARRLVFAAVLSGAIAASLVAGVFVDRTLFAPAAGMLQANGTGQVFAEGGLADGLSNRVSGTAGEVRIGLSFRTAHTVCRTFSTASGLSGLGCRDGQRWVVPMVVSGRTGAQEQTEYRLAAGDVAPSVMTEVDKRMVGDPLSPAEEKALMASGWRAHH